MSRQNDQAKEKNELVNKKKKNNKRTENNMSKGGNFQLEKKDTQQSEENIQSKTSKRLGILTLIGLMVLLFYSPYFRGLYFNQEMSTTFMYSGLLFLIFLTHKLLNRDLKIIKSPLDVAVAALMLAYFAPILLGTAVSAQYAWDMFLRYINYFLIYLVARDLTAGYRNITAILNAIVVSAIGVSVLGIDAGAGTKVTNALNWFMQNLPGYLHLKGGAANLMSFKFFGGYTEGRVFSTLQYPNVLAAYLSAVFILTTGLQMVSNAVWKRILYGAAGFVLIYTLLLTGSRGMLLVFPIVLVLLLIALRRKQLIIDFIITAGTPAFVSLLISYKYNYNELINSGSYNMVWLSVLLGALTTGLILAIAYKIKGGLYKVNNKIYALVAGVMIVLIIVGIGFGLKLEKPLVIKHNISEPDSEKSVIRDISGIKPSSKYSLGFNIGASSSQPNKNAYKVIVYGINQFAELGQLAELSGGAENTAKSLDFVTKPDTKNIRIYMSNYSTGTSAAFSSLSLKDNSTGELRRVVAQYMYLPTELVYKVKDINLKTHNVWQRFTFVQDAFKIIADYPLGAGGGGWRTLYHKYQAYGYASNEVHNHPVQLWVETGIIGFVILLVVLGLIAHHFYKARRGMKEINEDTAKRIILSSVVFTAIVSLYAHSVIDFDFSLSALPLLVWTLAGLVSGFFIQRREMFVVKLGGNILATFVVGILALTLVVAGFGSLYGRVVISETNKYGGKFSQEQLKAAAPELASISERYLALQPLDEERRLDYLMFCATLSNDNPDYGKILGENLNTALRNEPHSFKTLFQASSLHISAGDFQTGLAYADKVVESGRFIGELYKSKAQIYLTAGKNAVMQGKPDLGKTYLEVTKNIKAEIDEANKKSMKPLDMPSGIDDVVKEAEAELAKL